MDPANTIQSQKLKRLFHRSESLMEQGEFEQAAEACSRFLDEVESVQSIWPADKYAQAVRATAFNLAMALNRLRQFQKALEWIDIGMARHPTSVGRAVALAIRAEGLLGLGKTHESRAAFDEAIQAHPIEGRLHSAAVVVRQGTDGSLELAEAWVEEVFKQDGYSLEPQQVAMVHTILGNIRLRHEDIESARNHFLRALEAFPKYQEAREQIRRLPPSHLGSTGNSSDPDRPRSPRRRSEDESAERVTNRSLLLVIGVIALIVFTVLGSWLYLKTLRLDQTRPVPSSRMTLRPSVTSPQSTNALLPVQESTPDTISNSVQTGAVDSPRDSLFKTPAQQAHLPDPPSSIAASNNITELMEASEIVVSGKSTNRTANEQDEFEPLSLTELRLLWPSHYQSSNNTLLNGFESQIRARAALMASNGASRRLSVEPDPLNTPSSLRPLFDQQKTYKLPEAVKIELEADLRQIEELRASVDAKQKTLSRLRRKLDADLPFMRMGNPREVAIFNSQVEEYNREVIVARGLQQDFKHVVNQYNAKLRHYGQPTR